GALTTGSSLLGAEQRGRQEPPGRDVRGTRPGGGPESGEPRSGSWTGAQLVFRPAVSQNHPLFPNWSGRPDGYRRVTSRTLLTSPNPEERHPDMGAVQITLGGISVVLGIVAWGMFAATIVKFVQIIRLGQPDASRNGPVLARLATMVKEFAAHTRMNKYRSVGIWHWLVMWGFLLGSLALFEAYGEVFVPTWGWPI